MTEVIFDYIRASSGRNGYVSVAEFFLAE